MHVHHAALACVQKWVEGTMRRTSCRGSGGDAARFFQYEALRAIVRMGFLPSRALSMKAPLHGSSPQCSVAQALVEHVTFEARNGANALVAELIMALRQAARHPSLHHHLACERGVAALLQAGLFDACKQMLMMPPKRLHAGCKSGCKHCVSSLGQSDEDIVQRRCMHSVVVLNLLHALDAGTGDKPVLAIRMAVEHITLARKLHGVDVDEGCCADCRAAARGSFVSKSSSSSSAGRGRGAAREDHLALLPGFGERVAHGAGCVSLLELVRFSGHLSTLTGLSMTPINQLKGMAGVFGREEGAWWSGVQEWWVHTLNRAGPCPGS